MQEPLETFTSELGSRIRQRRSDQRRTLADVAGRAGVSVSYLAAIESGRSVPSLSVLSRVAHSLDLQLSELLRGTGPTVLRAGRLEGSVLGVSQLSHPDLRLGVRSVVADPGEAGPWPFDADDGNVVIHVTAGALTVSLDGQTHELLEGDSLHATRAAEVSWSIPEGGRSVSLWVLVATDEPD